MNSENQSLLTHQADAGASLQVLSLALGTDAFALETSRVLEVLDLVPVATVPNSRDFVRGLINVRGKVVPVVDLKIHLGMKRATVSLHDAQDARIVVLAVELAGEETLIGILADKVFQVMEIDAASLEEAPSVGIGWRSEYIRSIGKTGDDFIVVLDIEKIFGSTVNT